jgi:hypothetical protein
VPFSYVLFITLVDHRAWVDYYWAALTGTKIITVGEGESIIA